MTPVVGRTPQIQTSAEQPLQERKRVDDEGVDNFQAITDGVILEECPELPAAATATALTGKKLLLRDALTGKPVYFDEDLATMCIDSNSN